MRIALGSIFRNSSQYIPRYFEQVAKLESALHGRHTLRLVLVEGDSTDDTWELIKMFASEGDDISQLHHGGKVYGPMDHPQRWVNISMVCNHLLERLTDKDEIFIYVESDLIWSVGTMTKLLAHLHAVDVVSPLCIGRDGCFYDTWGYRKDGQQFSKEKPYHPELAPAGLTEIDSAGSCIVMSGKVAHESRFNPPHLGIVGWCQDMHARGYTHWLDGRLEVKHP